VRKQRISSERPSFAWEEDATQQMADRHLDIVNGSGIDSMVDGNNLGRDTAG
jgi:hypothetical protein